MNRHTVASKHMVWVLVAALFLTYVPMAAVAQSGCNHNCAVDACGYREAAPCNHTHGDICGEGGASCKHIHGAECDYVEAAPCDHSHDEACGGLTASVPMQNGGVVSAFAPLGWDVLFQTVAAEARRMDLSLPDALAAVVDGQDELIAGVTWLCDRYDEETGMTTGEYTWTAVLPEGYEPAPGVALPSVTATAGRVGFMALAVMAQGTTFTIDDFDWEILSEDDKTAVLVRYAGVSLDLTIPDTVPYDGKDYTVTEIGRTAFYYHAQISKVTIPSTVRVIRSEAFLASSLATIEFAPGSSLRTIEERAFASCGSLQSITIPASVETIGEFAFGSCTALTTFDFENGSLLTSIGDSVFDGCDSLSSITIPRYVSSIGVGAFQMENHPALATITVDSYNTHFKVEDGVLFNIDMTTLVAYPPSLYDNDNEYVIPDDVKTIYGGAFASCTLEKITFPDTVSTIESSAFLTCPNLDNVVLPPNLLTLEAAVFWGCIGLTNITLPDGLTKIDTYAFEECTGLTEITLPDSVTEIGNSAFKDCTNLTLVKISEEHSQLAILEESAFAGCNKLSIFLPPSLNLPDIGDFHLYNYEPATITVYTFYDSDAAQWCRNNGYPYILMPSSGEMQSNPPPLMYQYIPYQFTAKTRVPDNMGLFFSIEREDGSHDLPLGLQLADGSASDNSGLVPGTIYGSPLDYSDFEAGVSFTMYAKNIGDFEGYFTAKADFTIKLANRPTDAELAAINAYILIPDGGDDGKIDIVITGDRASYSQVQVMYTNGPFALFDSLWIDGIKKALVTEYDAADGSTRITILAQTIQGLDNGEHTAAAAFTRADGEGSNGHNSDLDVVAQNFTVNLSDSNEPRGNDSGDGDTSGNNTDGNNTSGNDTGANDPGGNGPGGNGTGGNAPGGNGPSGGNPGNNDPDGNTPGDGGPGGAGLGDLAVAIEGLPMDENGNYFFNLDGSGTPLELRIDIPLDQYLDLDFDGSLWEMGVDYRAISGSTILIFTAERLEKLEAGEHTLQAIFATQTVSVTFMLNKLAYSLSSTSAEQAAPEPAQASTVVDRSPESDGEVAASENTSITPMIVSVFGMLLVAIAGMVWFIRYRKRTRIDG